MAAISPTYEIQVMLEATREGALEQARRIAELLADVPGVGAVAVRPLDPEPSRCRGSIGQLVSRTCPA